MAYQCLIEDNFAQLLGCHVAFKVFQLLQSFVEFVRLVHKIQKA
jgi:hypothetical protein